MFNKETYINRRKQLKSNVKEGLLLFPGNGQSSMNFDANWYPFYQDKTFLYYTGINRVANLYFIVDMESGEEILFGDDPTPEEMVWIGATEKLQSLAEKGGVAQIKPMRELADYLKKAVQKGKKTHYLPPYRAQTKIEISKLLDIPLDEVESKKSISFLKAVVAQRNIKTDEELTELNKAVNLTADMHRHAMRNALPGRTEMEIAGELQAIAIGGGGNISFPIILTKDGQYLHNHATQAKLKKGDLVLCDCGAETASGYGGDMTRTFSCGQGFTERQKEMYDIVLNAHNSAIEALKPGTRFKDIHLLASKKLFEGLKALNLTKGDADEAVQQGAHTMFFQCGLGHMMGLDIHDMENLGEQYVGYTDELKKSTDFGLKSLRLGKELEVGNVVTVEPGIYINPFLIDEWKAENKFTDFVNYSELEKYKDFGGIRIEEDFVIRKDGYELLGKPLAKTAEDIERVKVSGQSQ